jgi:hypothetical protein
MLRGRRVDLGMLFGFLEFVHPFSCSCRIVAYCLSMMILRMPIRGESMVPLFLMPKFRRTDADVDATQEVFLARLLREEYA